MKYLVISPRTGVVGISRFSTAYIERGPSQLPEKKMESVTSQGLCNLDRRRTAPLVLTAALLARLPRCQKDEVAARRKN
jgi:hypothetical protein